MKDVENMLEKFINFMAKGDDNDFLYAWVSLCDVFFYFHNSKATVIITTKL